MRADRRLSPRWRKEGAFAEANPISGMHGISAGDIIPNRVFIRRAASGGPLVFDFLRKIL